MIRLPRPARQAGFALKLLLKLVPQLHRNRIVWQRLFLFSF
jgi:hypothetical protein